MGNKANQSPAHICKPIQKRLTLDNFQLLKFISQSRFGKIYKVKHLQTDQIYSMKIMKKSQLHIPNKCQQAKTENYLLKNLNHPFIAQLKYAFQSDHKIFIVTDHCEESNLRQTQLKLGPLSEAQVQFIAGQCLLVLDYLHDNNVIYRMLKPQNIFVDSQGYLKLTNFMLSKMIQKKQKIMNSSSGNSSYKAPEILLKQQYTQKLDLWCLGVLLYELRSGYHPFYHINTAYMFRKIAYEQPEYPSFFTDMLISLIEGLLCKEPKKRLNVKQAMNHPFFTDFEWDKISKKCIKSPILIDEFQNSNESSPKLSPDSNPGNIFKNLSEFSFDYELKTEGLDK